MTFINEEHKNMIFYESGHKMYVVRESCVLLPSYESKIGSKMNLT